MARKKKTSKKRKNTKKAKAQPRSLRNFLLKWVIVLGLWGFIFLTALILWYAKDLPDITESASFERKNAITVLDQNGETLMRYGEIKGDNVRAEDLPPYLIDAVLAIEDRRFYTHFGIDPIGLARAMVTNLLAGGVVQGGSTITQQLAKNLFLSRERSYERKIKEALLALWLEYQLSKDEILSAYLNRVYLGAGTYGVDAASRLYFGKDVKDITLQEAAVLAGLLKAPSRYSPSRNPGLSKERANVVLNAMVAAGYLSENQIKDMTNLPPRPVSKPSKGQSVRYFTDWAIDGIDMMIGTPPGDITIHTTLDRRIQTDAETALTRALLESSEQRNASQGAVLIMGLDGRVLGMVGGRDYKLSQFNRAVQAKRQPGSAFKPFVYLTALKQGWDPDDMILDEPFTKGKYKPENYAGEYFGEVRLEEAMGRSLNTAAVRLMDAIGRQPVIDTAHELGIRSELQSDLSLALGTSAVSMLELTTAYTAIANGGYAVFPYAITKITDANGNILYEKPKRLKTRKIIDQRPLEDIDFMLRSVVANGTARGAQIPGILPAGKTGTSQDSRDAWFVGYTDRFIGAVWMGNDDNAPMDEVTGGSYPARIWSQVMAPAQKRRGTGDIPRFDVENNFENLLNSIFGGSSSAPRRNYREEKEQKRERSPYNN